MRRAVHVALALKKKLTNGVITNCDEWISNAANDINRKLSIEEIRNIRVSFYIESQTQRDANLIGEVSMNNEMKVFKAEKEAGLEHLIRSTAAIAYH